MTLSIIIATYNVVTCLQNCLDSIINQNYQDWECIIVDGLSNDGTLDIVKEYCRKDQRFQYVSEKDNGIYDAFNKGWKMSHGIWTYYLGADDTICKDGMTLLFDYIEKHKCCAILGGEVNLIKDGVFYKKQSTNGIKGCHQAFIMKREILRELGGFDEKYKIIADRDLLVRCAQKKYNIANIPVVVANFSLGGQSQSLNNLYRVTKERYYIYKINKYVEYPFFVCLLSFAKNYLAKLKWSLY